MRKTVFAEPGRKWRPSLALVIGGTLGAVLSLPIAGLFSLRALAPMIGTRWSFVLIGCAILVLTGVLCLLLLRILVVPIRQLGLYARALGRGEQAEEPRHYGTPELYGLGRTVIGMADALKARETAVRGYAQHLTHELKSPLTSIMAAAELLEAGGGDARLSANVAVSARRMRQLLDALRRHAEAGTAGRGVADLPGVLEDLRHGHPDLAIRADVVSRQVPLSSEVLRAVLDQLAGNASAHGAGRLNITADALGLTVSDDGPGIDPSDRERIFQPFFTTRRESGGTGMGLAIARALVESQGGRIDLAAVAAEGLPGAAFRIRFASSAL